MTPYTVIVASPTVQPSLIVNWHKDVWNGAFSPKLRVFIWSMLQNALPTGENLQFRGINNSAVCPRCGDSESMVHIFFSCPFAKKVWELIPLKDVVHLATIQSCELAVIGSRNFVCLPPTGITTNILP